MLPSGSFLAESRDMAPAMDLFAQNLISIQDRFSPKTGDPLRDKLRGL